MPLIELDAKGVRESAGLFEGIERRATDVRPAWTRLARWLMDWQAGRFRRQPWTQLDADTIRQKGNRRILHLSGTLERALTVWKAPGQTLDLEPDSMRFGLDPRGIAYYGTFHQHGDSVPVRTVLDAPHGVTSKRASDFLLDHLLGRL